MDIIRKSNSFDSISTKPEKKTGFKYNLQYVFLVFLIMAFSLIDVKTMPEVFQKNPLLFNALKALLIVIVFFLYQKMYN